MNDNINLTKILKGCPRGTKFYSSVLGEVELLEIKEGYPYPIVLRCFNGDKMYITVEGMLFPTYNGECTLFPSKDQRDWSKFERFWDKPKKERFNPKTLKPFDKVLGRNFCSSRWKCSLFSHIIDESIFPYICIGNGFTYCIPYNDDTKHLAGTDEEAPEYYRYWEE